MLHTTPAIDSIGLTKISKHTKSDAILDDLRALIKQGKKWILKTADPKLRKLEQILPEITVRCNGILLEVDRVILPESLQKNRA